MTYHITFLNIGPKGAFRVVAREEIEARDAGCAGAWAMGYRRHIGADTFALAKHPVTQASLKRLHA